MNFFSRVNQHRYGCPWDNANRHSSMLNAYTKEVLQFVKKYGQFPCLVSGYHGEDLLVGRQGQVLRRAGCHGKDLAGQPLCRGYNCTRRCGRNSKVVKEREWKAKWEMWGEDKEGVKAEEEEGREGEVWEGEVQVGKREEVRERKRDVAEWNVKVKK